MRCLALLSGGLDSLVAATLAGAEHDLALALTCDYGQRAAKREIEAAREQAKWLGCRHQIVALPWLGALGGSALTEEVVALPEPSLEDLGDTEVISQTARAVWVPNRNAVLVNVAAAFAERLGATAVVCGFNREEAATFRDNSRAFVAAVNRLWRYSTATTVRLLAPTLELDKREIVRQGRALGAPLHLVWSCYQGGERQCGRCESCRRLARALEAEGE